MIKENMSPEEIKYEQYIKEHIANVQKVWSDVQPLLKDDFWLDDYKFFTIQYKINVHDQSKFSLIEFDGYRRKFYRADGEAENDRSFNYSWLHHIRENDHHWEHWVIPCVNECKALSMPFIFIIEMLCDWTAMSYKFKDIPGDFFNRQKDHMVLHEETQKIVTHYLPLFDQVAREHNGTQHD